MEYLEIAWKNRYGLLIILILISIVFGLIFGIGYVLGAKQGAVGIAPTLIVPATPTPTPVLIPVFPEPTLA